LKALGAAEPGPVATERLISLIQKESVDRFGTPERWTELTKPFPFQRAWRKSPQWWSCWYLVAPATHPSDTMAQSSR